MKQVLTVSCKIQVTPEQVAKIDATLQAFADACEYVNKTAPVYFCTVFSGTKCKNELVTGSAIASQ